MCACTASWARLAVLCALDFAPGLVRDPPWLRGLVRCDVGGIEETEPRPPQKDRYSRKTLDAAKFRY